MDSSLTNAYTIKIENFEGPFDLLFHLLEKNQVSIYDIPINEITDQYMEYLFGMKELNLEIASEFLVMAATLLHIKSKMLLPDKKEKADDEGDPRDELVQKLIEYKRYKDFSFTLREREKVWDKVFYKLPEVYDFKWESETLELLPEELVRVYSEILENNIQKSNVKTSATISEILQHEKVSIRSKMREVISKLLGKSFFVFSDLFKQKKKSKVEIVTCFLAILELSKLKKIKLEQRRQFADIIIKKNKEANQ